MNVDVLITAMARVLVTLSGVAGAVLTARTLGVEGRGDYFYVVTIALIATQFANLGLPSSNTYLSARDRSLVPQLFFNSVWLALLLGPLAVFGVVAVNTAFLGASLRPWNELGWALVLAPCALLYTLTTSLLVGIQEFRRYNIIAIVGSLLQLILMGVLAVTSPNVAGFLAISVVSTSLSCFAVALVLSKRFPLRPHRSFSVALASEGVGLASRAFLILLLGYAISRMPVLALGVRGDSHSVGIVSIVVQFLDVLAIVPSSAALVLFPQLVSAREADRGARTFNATIWITCIMIAGCAVLAVVADPLITLLFGQAYRPSAEALRWALPGVVLLSMVNVFGQYLAAARFPVSTIFAWAAAAIVAYVLSPDNGGPDAPRQAAAALSWSYAVLAVGLAGIFARRLHQVTREATT